MATPVASAVSASPTPVVNATPDPAARISVAEEVAREEAMAEVRRWLENGATRCGDSYYAREAGCIIQYREVYQYVGRDCPEYHDEKGNPIGGQNPIAVREKERTQGIEWKGVTYLGWKEYRKYCVNWSDWRNDRPQICVSAMKKNGKWEIDTEINEGRCGNCGHHQGIFKIGHHNQKLDCDSIPRG
jgi:hypothetical protein